MTDVPSIGRTFLQVLSQNTGLTSKKGMIVSTTSYTFPAVSLLSSCSAYLRDDDKLLRALPQILQSWNQKMKRTWQLVRARPSGKPYNRWEDEERKDAANLLNTENWSGSARRRSDWRKKTGDAMARKLTEEPKEEEEEEEMNYSFSFCNNPISSTPTHYNINDL